jgi:hypothetical protein
MCLAVIFFFFINIHDGMKERKNQQRKCHCHKILTSRSEAAAAFKANKK